ncbi:hypothetical protein GDI2282 [Gluconacetobacter diazotrophicus PA1 5]|uniref:Uncharacterized protein n=1 Tax=Gluconacetobacter diazotrophicus (strain ATCC 49037 / DSM 5601 / CCUG 37298 / CIP 103539 / LMG 7603 / PAl5) TaxID=272568 RepID=A9HLX7_GLUDA|nr:hypothetical protein GDI2282 [Gluconacetobacter diazotrophicus PA1 5]
MRIPPLYCIAPRFAKARDDVACLKHAREFARSVHRSLDRAGFSR